MIKSNRWGRAGIAAVAAATLLPLAACTDGAEAAADGGQAGTKGGQVADGGGEATIRFNWWGSDARARTQEAFIEICMAEHPEITVLGETASWNDYQMRLATQAAANDIPDVFMFIDPFMYEYIDAGHMLDLRTVADYLDLSDFPEITFADVTGPNGEIWGVSTGHSGHGMIINPAVFERYGIDLPDDTTWSWDDFKEISIAISEASAAAGGQTVGSTIKMTNQMLQVWLRQRGETLAETADAPFGATAETVASFVEFVQSLQESGAAVDPATAMEMWFGGGSPEQSVLALGHVGFYFTAVNQLWQFEEAAGHELLPALWPGEADAAQNGAWIKEGTFVGISANTRYPRAAATLVNCLVNVTIQGRDPQALAIV